MTIDQQMEHAEKLCLAHPNAPSSREILAYIAEIRRLRAQNEELLDVVDAAGDHVDAMWDWHGQTCSGNDQCPFPEPIQRTLKALSESLMKREPT